MKKVLNRQSNKILFNGYKFDSQLEYETYCILLKKFDVDDIKVHLPLQIKPKTNHFRAINLKLDFYIKSVDLWIESKGILEYDFSLKLAMLDVMHPTILNKLIIVVRQIDDTFRKFGKTHDLLIFSIHDLQQNNKIQRGIYGI